jgi:mono/diheme cytochrome c family protein
MWKSLWISACLTLPALAAVEFNRDVRPILSDKCFQCHGPDAKAKNIPLRLDVEAEAKARAIVPGDPAGSELIRRVTAEKARRMPPAYTGHTLSVPEVETLRTWIAEGAAWQAHWSFIPPRKAPAEGNPIDFFVQDRLKREGLSPAPLASREALLRRVSFDLTGLPPSPEERDAFLNDRSPNAYERLVDRLLVSPRFGERMAARWLDWARYADSNGYQYDGERVMWRWRDYVIESFNSSKPFDRFTLEQIAGDLLPGSTRADKIATGFNRNHRINTEDGIVPEEYAVEYVVDRVETVGAVFLGLTTGCARCHNHKYDPLTQREFYQFFAYFNNVPEIGRGIKYGNSHPYVPAPTAAQERELNGLNARIGELERRAAAEMRTADPASYRPLTALDYEQEYPAAEPRVAGSAGQWDIDDRFTLSARIYSDGTPDGPILTRMVDDPQGKGYGLHADQGKVHVHLTSVWADDATRVETAALLKPRTWHTVTVTYDGSKLATGIRIFVDGEAVEHKTLLETLYRPFNNARTQFPQPLRIGMGWGKERRFNGRIEQSRAWARILDEPQIAAMAGRGDAARAARWAYLESTPLGRELGDLRWQRERLEASFPTVMVMAERPQRRDTFLLIRGAYDKPGEKVEPALPSFLKAPPARDRLELARWLVNPANPLTARVTVNRFWQMLFGTGLVKTTEDFGQQGEWPSHPELLDWLAVDFIESGWNVKTLLRKMVMSETYRQRAQASPELLQRDPENRLLARGPRTRLAAEMVRDQALLASGLLVERVGGRSVKPYQPAGLWKEITMQDGEYVRDTGESLYRRSLYTFWRRTVAPPMMLNFDSAQRETCTVRESRTNTPLQALNLMNDETFLEAARHLGGVMMREGLASGYIRVLSRRPKPAELDVLNSSLAYHRDYFADAGKARAFLAQGESRVETADATEAAAHMAVASMILNLDEAVNK